MHNMFWYVCGQCVHNLRKVIGTTCQYPSTVSTQSVTMTQSLCVHHRLIRTFVPTVPLLHSTATKTQPSLLLSSYTHFPQYLLLPQPNEI